MTMRNCEICDKINFCFNSFFYSIVKDFILPLFIAFLAAYIAYYIFIIETKRDKKKDQAIELRNANHSLIYLAFLVSRSLKTSIQLKNHIKDFCKKIKQDNINFHQLGWTPIYDLQRVNEEKELKGYLMSYVHKYTKGTESQSQRLVDEFSKTIESIDFLYTIFNSIPEQISKAQMYDYERKKEFKYLVTNSVNIVADIIHLNESSEEIYNLELLDVYSTYTNGSIGLNPDMKYHYKNFLIPVNNICVKAITNEPQISLHFKTLAIHTRDGKQLFEEIGIKNCNLRHSLIGDFKSICRCINNLEKHSSKLLTDFTST